MSGSDVSFGLFSINNPPDCRFQNARTTGLRPSEYAHSPRFPSGGCVSFGLLSIDNPQDCLFQIARTTGLCPSVMHAPCSLSEIVFHSAYFPEALKPQGFALTNAAYSPDMSSRLRAYGANRFSGSCKAVICKNRLSATAKWCKLEQNHFR